MARSPSDPTGRVRCRLLHASEGCRIVMAALWHGSVCEASALAEASTVEEAEDRALRRLHQRLTGRSGPQEQLEAPQEPHPQEPHPQETPEPAAAESPDPEDWSEELTAIDLELERLGWSREQESRYLQRACGHPGRSRITRYGELCGYLSTLRRLPPGADPDAAAVPLRRGEMLQQGDELMRRLGWSAEHGRAWLERHFQRLSRQQLNDEQLLAFNMQLEEEWLRQSG